MTRKQLLFRAEASCRYHLCRAEHFASRDSWISILSIFAGTGVMVEALATNPFVAPISPILGIVIAYLNTWRMVTKPTEVSLQHMKWSKAWAKFKGEVEASTQLTAEQRMQLVKKANELDGECTDDMRAVKAYCFNDALTALGRKDLEPYKINWFQKLTKHTFKYTHAFANQNQDAVAAKAKRKAEKEAQSNVQQSEQAARLALAR